MKIMLIDGNSLINRAYYGIKQLTAPDGTPTNAVYGFLRILNKLLADETPDALLVAFDTREKTFRHEMFDGYKATRHGMPDELAVQMPMLKDVLDAMNVARAECPGYEADDILGAAARDAGARAWECVIVTGDRDSLQLVGDAARVLLIKTRMGQTETTDYTAARFAEEYGFAPEKLVDLKALMGDASDNIPGVAGIGEKTAMSLMQAFGSLDAVYANVDSRAAAIKDTVRKKLEAGRESASLSRELATIRAEIPAPLDLEGALRRDFDHARLYELFSRFGFTSLIVQMGVETPEEEPETFEIPRDLDVSKIGENIKDQLRAGLDGGWTFDVSLAAYVVNPTDRSYDLRSLSARYLNRSLGEGDAARNVALARLYLLLSEKLREMGSAKLYNDIELPLCRVLADMEETGMLVDRGALASYAAMLGERIGAAETAVYALAEESFNINSPKQLGVILFEKLGLPAPKKTKTGYSTGADILDRLEEQHPIITAVKEYRELSKLKATYADGLMKVVAPDGRVHTSFQMTATATGRLSSTEPNLQNIPIRRKLGERLRGMFIAPEGSLLVDADYSQIELRLLAHIAQDPAMLEAFRTGEDIHAVTAARVFGVPLADVTPTLRSRAKAVNFGMVYGISAFSLSKDIGVSVAEAKEYMESYFARFSGVRAYMVDIVEQGKRDGFVTTLFGRR
ncbi:MAG: DNA polymerase I, partial [Oscillospiraceae bacterium]|nr:DNA polymerase I [Oscillospiraceae bacterium]